MINRNRLTFPFTAWSWRLSLLCDKLYSQYVVQNFTARSVCRQMKGMQVILGHPSFALRLLVLETYKCHSMSRGKEALWQLQEYIKAPIVSWKNPFKNLCQTTYDDWMPEMEHKITPAGWVKAPTSSCSCNKCQCEKNDWKLYSVHK